MKKKQEIFFSDSQENIKMRVRGKKEKKREKKNAREKSRRTNLRCNYIIIITFFKRMDGNYF